MTRRLPVSLSFLLTVLLLPVTMVTMSGCLSGPFNNAAYEGTWYEQDANGCTLTIKGNSMKYSRSGNTEEVIFSPLNTDDGVQLVPEEEYWFFIEFFYDPYEDKITARTLPHTDGDGGYHLVTFLRTEYAAPPEPVYGERIDQSDPDAPKDFSDYNVKALTLDVCEPWRDNGDMAPEQPVHGSYSYELTVNEDGAGQMVSDFCGKIKLSEEQLDRLAGMLKESGLAKLNGIDIITEDMPEDTPMYDLNIEFASGETYHSKANGKDIDPLWETAGRELHKFLFELFVSAGYNVSTGEFHSSEPMLRVCSPESDPADYSVSVNIVRTNAPEGSYEYSVYSEYPEFSMEGNASDNLTGTLQDISRTYQKLAAEDLKYDTEIMESVDDSVWKTEEHRTSYSFYTTIHESADRTKYFFWIDEGHSNCYGMGKHGYGEYTYTRYCIDAESGKIMALADFFKDDKELLSYMTELLLKHNSSDDRKEVLLSESYQKKLLSGLTLPESEGGIGFEPGYDGIYIYVNESFGDEIFFPYGLRIYYDDIQEMLNPRYATES